MQFHGSFSPRSLRLRAPRERGNLVAAGRAGLFVLSRGCLNVLNPAAPSASLPGFYHGPLPTNWVTLLCRLRLCGSRVEPVGIPNLLGDGDIEFLPCLDVLLPKFHVSFERQAFLNQFRERRVIIVRVWI